MAIVVSCPHCETKFNLQPDMVGKSMRCPNLDCRQVFTVKPQAREIEPPKSDPTPVPQPRPMPLPPEPGKGGKGKKPQPAIVDAQIVEAAVVSPPKVKEVVWSEGADLPPATLPGGRAAAQAESLDGTDEQPILRRKKKTNRGPVVLIGMIVLGVLVSGAIVFYLMRLEVVAEQNLAKQADEEYGKGEHATAAKTFEQLATKYPESKEALRYQFFADLSNMQVAVRAVTNRENPDVAIERFKQFIAAQKESPLAKPKSGFGTDILEAGRKLGEDVAGHADDRVKAFRADRGGKPGELDRAEKTVATGRELLPMIEQFRSPDDRPLDTIRADLEAVEAQVKRERERTVAINRARADLENLTDTNIQRVENDLAAAGFDGDDEARSLIAAAKGRLLELVVYIPEPAEARTPPTSSAATILFVSPIGPTRRRPLRESAKMHHPPSSWRWLVAFFTPSTRTAARYCGHCGSAPTLPIRPRWRESNCPPAQPTSRWLRRTWPGSHPSRRMLCEPARRCGISRSGSPIRRSRMRCCPSPRPARRLLSGAGSSCRSATNRGRSTSSTSRPGRAEAASASASRSATTRSPSVRERVSSTLRPTPAAST